MMKNSVRACSSINGDGNNQNQIMAAAMRWQLRKSEPIYRELGLAKKDLRDEELIELMVKHPDLMQRPIVERGKRAVLGRPTENVDDLL